MGEAKRRAAAAVQDQLTALGVELLGGRVQVRWNQHFIIGVSGLARLLLPGGRKDPLLFD